MTKKFSNYLSFLLAMGCFFAHLTPSFAAFPLDAVPTDRGAIHGGAGAPGDLILNWTMPIRAYTGLTTSWTVVAREWHNQPLTYSMTGAPSGMTIDSSTGTITYVTPSAAGSPYAGIQVTATRAACNSTEFPSCSLTASQTFTLTVSQNTTNDFCFVAPTTASPAGADGAACGTTAAPCLTLSGANGCLAKVSGTNGKTIYVDSGNYTESWAQGSNGIADATTFPQSDYLEIAQKPGSATMPIIDAAVASGLPVSNTAQFIAIHDLEIKNSTAADRGNFVLRGTHIELRDVVSHDASFSGDFNCTGINIAGVDDIVVARTASYNNTTALGNLNNVSNYLIYNDTASGDRFIWDWKSWGSKMGLKIKHTNADNARAIVQNGEAQDPTGVAGYGKNSSIRYTVGFNNTSAGFNANFTDPGFTVQGMLVEHNDWIGPMGMIVYSGFATTGTFTSLRNIVHITGGACGATCGTRKAIQHWEDTLAATARAYPYLADYNDYYNSSGDSNCFNIGGCGAMNLTTMQALGASRDAHSILSNPGFNNLAGGDLHLLSSTAAKFSTAVGDFAGAYQPGRTDYGTAGTQTVTRIHFACPSSGGGGTGGTGGGDGGGYNKTNGRQVWR